LAQTIDEGELNTVMLTANQVSLFFTVAMLAVTAYFLFGSIPLLILKHDNNMDSKFIRSFYITYFKFAIVVSTAAAISYAAAFRPIQAMGAFAIAILTLVLRFKLIPQLDQCGSEIREDVKDVVQKNKRCALIVESGLIKEGLSCCRL